MEQLLDNVLADNIAEGETVEKSDVIGCDRNICQSFLDGVENNLYIFSVSQAGHYKDFFDVY